MAVGNVLYVAIVTCPTCIYVILGSRMGLCYILYTCIYFLSHLSLSLSSSVSLPSLPSSLPHSLPHSLPFSLRCLALQTGDQILSINGTSTEHLMQAEITALLDNTRNVVNLEVAYEAAGEKQHSPALCAWLCTSFLSLPHSVLSLLHTLSLFPFLPFLPSPPLPTYLFITQLHMCAHPYTILTHCMSVHSLTSPLTHTPTDEEEEEGGSLKKTAQISVTREGNGFGFTVSGQ